MGRIYQRKPGGPWHGYWTDARGRHHRQALGTRDKAVARERLRQLELVSTDPAAHSRHALTSAIADMLAVVAVERAGATHRAYAQKGRHLVRVLGDVELGELTRDQVLLYVRTRQHETASLSTIHKELVVLRRALAEARNRGLWRGDIAALVPKVRVVYRPREVWLTEHQAEQLLERIAPRRRLWVALGLYGGLSLGEIERLRWEHVDLRARHMRIPGTKREGRWRAIPIAPRLVAELERSAPAAPAKRAGPVADRWRNVRRDLAIACEAARVPRVTPNDLRRTFASWLKNQRVDSAVVARLLGHSSTRMVDLVYGRLSEDTLADALDQLPVGGARATGVQDAPASQATSETPADPAEVRKPAKSRK